jgi:2-keto-4-pentenoate hydratase/2-oxohepta-3-ene-1,7-dioic acid hydratase in catechol pathway
MFAIGTFSAGGRAPFPAVVVQRDVFPVSAFGDEVAAFDSVLALLKSWDTAFPLIAKRVGSVVPDKRIPLDRLEVHAPLLPRQIFCTGANYRQHVLDLMAAQASPETAAMTAEERRAYAARMMDGRIATGRPYAFSKAVSAVTGPNDRVIIPRDVTEPDWELELGVIIGRPARHVGRTDALSCVAGYTVANDITARERIYRPDIKAIGTDWLAGKCAPTFLPIGPFIVPAAFVPDPMNLRITLRLNGEVMQDASTVDMMFDIARQIEHISSCVQLLPGDLICTGSPAGNGTHYGRFLRPGDILNGTIETIGTIRNACEAEPSAAATRRVP